MISEGRLTTRDGYRFVVTPRRLARFLGIALTGLFALHILTMIVSHGFGRPVAMGLVPAFHLDFEQNLPTFAAVLLLIACSLISAWSGLLETAYRRRRTWLILAAVFLLLAADEAFSFHEPLGEALYQRYTHLGVPMYAWTLPYGFAVIVAGLYFLPWFLAFERTVQIRLVLAGGIFLSGAIGLELAGSAHYESLAGHREVYRTLTGDILTTIEEACEYLGLSLFLHTVVTRLGGVSFRALDPVTNEATVARV